MFLILPDFNLFGRFCNKKVCSKKSFKINSHLKAISQIANSTEPITKQNVGGDFRQSVPIS
ncbi:hypothetical protein A3Q56_02878 [Intoshia linei]|uniref:Uncharacterized protein n=1 Tax=Intoshia linei TaxID=1819745 RepID=A0A177B5A1_9BILA|nr:hypothetical protein A3Q56_02878 [Intoshia linei]